MGIDRPAASARVRQWILEQQRLFYRDRGRVALAVLAVTGVSVAMLPLRERLGVLNVALLFLMLSFLLGLWLGVRPAIIGALLSFVSFDFLFLLPYFTLTVAAQDHVLALVVYLVVAIGSSLLVSRVHERTWDLERESQRTALLYDLNRALIQEPTLTALLQAITRSVVEIYGAQGSRMLTLGAGDDLDVRARWPEDVPALLEREEQTMASWAVTSGQMAGLGTGGRTIRGPHRVQGRPREFQAHRATDVLYVPVRTPAGVRGVLEIIGRPGGGPFRQEDQLILQGFADQAALALERARLTEEQTRVAVLEQSDRLKSSLIAAVSHDLRTPLTAIKASSSALLDPSVTWSDDDRRQFAEAIDEEVDRLTFMVANLLDLSRIEGGALHPDLEWHDVSDLIDDSVRRVGRSLQDRTLRVEIDPELPLVAMDWGYMSQVMINLLSNAGRYTPPGTAVTVGAERRGSMVEIRVQDDGPGILPDKLPHLFEPFYRANQGKAIPGSGIGLSICKGLVEAHGGRIRVESQPGRGTTFVVQLPIERDKL